MTTIEHGRAAGPAMPAVSSPLGLASGQRHRPPYRLPTLAALSRRRILALGFTGCALAMLPWLVVLGFELPQTAEAPHWNIAWVGLDALEAVGLLATGLLLGRGDQRYAVTAALTGTALLTDAWFDVLTSASRADLLVATLMAGLIELPLSGLCFFLAFRAPRRSSPGRLR